MTESFSEHSVKLIDKSDKSKIFFKKFKKNSLLQYSLYVVDSQVLSRRRVHEIAKAFS